ncbi:MAG: hypothetical protein IJC94_00220 [Oscillospiraceae bacterium]|nr:hypothetical protein [Oscillospiraceae bacterium]
MVWKKLFALLLAALMLFSLFAAAASADEPAPTKWSGKREAFDDANGRGNSQQNPIIIDTPEKLAYLAERVLAGNSYRGTYFELGANIDLGKKIWDPIGSEAAPFEGMFNGKGFTVSGMYVCNSEYAGLFGCVESYAEIKNLNVEGNIFASGENSKCISGGIVGIASGKISNCYYKGTIAVSALGSCAAGGIVGGLGGEIANCKTYAAIIMGENATETAKAGGIAGYISGGSIENCRSDGEISACANDTALAGGVTGDSYNGSIMGCVTRCIVETEGATSVAGGIVGYQQSGNVIGCSSSRTVTAKMGVGGSDAAAGGIVGIAKAYISDCMNVGGVFGIGTMSAGGVVGRMEENASLLNSYNSADVTADSGYAAGIAAENAGRVINCYNIGSVSGAVVDGIVSGGSGKAEYCYTIATERSTALENCGTVEKPNAKVESAGGIYIDGRAYPESTIEELLNGWVAAQSSSFKGWKTEQFENSGYPIFSSDAVITASAGEGGTISPAGTIEVNNGESITFTITPEEGSRVKAVIVDGVAVGSMKNYTFSNVVIGHTIEVVFIGKGDSTVTMTSRSGDGGSISPDGVNEVVVGTDITYNIAVDDGYEIASVVVDGKETHITDQYVFENVTAPHNIEVKFKELPREVIDSASGRYIIDASSGEGGKLQFEGEISVSKGESLMLEVLPDKGWSIKSVTVDGVDMGKIESYTFRNIAEDHTISAEFEMNAAGGEPEEEQPQEEKKEEKSAVWIYVAAAVVVCAAAAAAIMLAKKRKTAEEEK